MQILSKDEPFFVGIYDGHGGESTSTYIAHTMGSVFEPQCCLDAQGYAEQPLSVEHNFQVYSRGNQ